MSFAKRFSQGYYTGRKVAVGLVPTAFPVAIDGRPFMLDTTVEGWGAQTVPSLRPYFLSQNALGEEVLNPDALWRHSNVSWHKGAGQLHQDRPDSDPARFNASKGVDAWTRDQLSLLHDTALARPSTATNLCLAVAGNYLYVADGAEVYRSTDLRTFTAVGIQASETPARQVVSLCSDGYTVYAALGGGGIHSTERGASTSGHYSDLSATLVGYVKGRIMAAQGRSIYNVTASGAAPTPLFTHPNVDWGWVGFAEGANVIYAAGRSGATSEVYRIGIKSDGTGLDAAIVAGRLLEGEVVRSIYAYAGFVVIGTDQGVRFAVPDSSGDLQIGALIKTGCPCRALTGWDRFVWFGWENYDTASTGLGRLDPTILNGGSAPAYASDLMADGQGQVVSLATFAPSVSATPAKAGSRTARPLSSTTARRVFGVSGMGLMVESVNLVESGYLDSGVTGYNIPDPKVPSFIDVRHADPLKGTFTVSLAVDDEDFSAVGTRTPGQQDTLFATARRSGETFEVRLTLNRDAAPTQGPVVSRMTLFSLPAPAPAAIVTLPLLLENPILDLEDSRRTLDVLEARQHIEGLHRSKQPFVWQEGIRRQTATLDDYQWMPRHFDRVSSCYTGVLVVKLKVNLS